MNPYWIKITTIETRYARMEQMNNVIKSTDLLLKALLHGYILATRRTFL